MKKILFLLTLVFVVAACNDDKEVEIGYQLTSNIDILDVVKNFKDLDGSLIFENGELLYDDEYIVLSYTVFDKDGSSIIDKEMELSDFASTTSITTPVKKGEYTIVVCAYIADDDKEWWIPEGKSKFKDYKIRYTDSWIGLSGVLGVWEQTITVNKSMIVPVNMEPAISMVLLDFDYLDLSGMQTIKLNLVTWNNFYDIAKDQGQLLELLNGGYLFEFKKGDYRNIVRGICYLPASKFTINWAGYNAKNELVRQGAVPSSAITAGKTKIIAIDTRTGAATTETKSMIQGTVEKVMAAECREKSVCR